MINEREVDEVIRLVKEAVTMLCPDEDDYAIECLQQALEYLTGEEFEYFSMGYRDSTDECMGLEDVEGEY